MSALKKSGCGILVLGWSLVACHANKADMGSSDISSVDTDSIPVLVAAKIPGGTCEGKLSWELQAVALANAELAGSDANGDPILKFESFESAKAASGRKDDCVVLGANVQDLKNNEVSTTLKGHFEPIICTGGCPGFSVRTLDGKIIWLSLDTKIPAGANEKGRLFKVRGLFEIKFIRSERASAAPVPTDVMKVDSIALLSND